MKVSASFLDQSTYWGGDHCWPSQVRREGKSPWTTIKETGVDNEWPFQSQVRRLYGSPDGPSVSVSVQTLSRSLQPHWLQHARPPCPSSQSPPKLMSIELVMPSSHLILYHPLLHLPSIFPSIRVFSSESVLRIKWPNYWSFSFNISPSNEQPGLNCFRMDWLDLLAVQGTLKTPWFKILMVLNIFLF